MVDRTTKEAVAYYSGGSLELVWDNIQGATKKALSTDAYYSTMVEAGSDLKDMYDGDNVSFNKKWDVIDVGLERTSSTGIYLSKVFGKRNDRSRGRTLIIRVKDNTKENLKNFVIL